jgi:hypothetical protein
MNYTKHHIENTSGKWIFLGMLVLSMSSFFLFHTIHALILVITFIPLMIIPSTIKSYLIIKDGKIYKYSSGGKNRSPELTITLSNKTYVESIDKSNYSIVTVINNNDYTNAFSFRIKLADIFLAEISQYVEEIKLLPDK